MVTKKRRFNDGELEKIAGFSTWGFVSNLNGEAEGLGDALGKLLDGALTDNLETYGINIDIHADGHIAVAIPFGVDEYEEPMVRVDLTELISDFLSLYEDNADDETDEDLHALAAKLKKALNQVEKHIAENVATGRAKPPKKVKRRK